MIKKYIICDYARADWGKTETLLEVINILDSPSNPQFRLVDEKPHGDGKDRWCLFYGKNKKIVVSTVGDPNSVQPIWLEDAAKAGADIIITASRTSGSTVNAVYDVSTRYGYEIFWFQNFHIDNSKFSKMHPMTDVRHTAAKCIVKIINVL